MIGIKIFFDHFAIFRIMFFCTTFKLNEIGRKNEIEFPTKCFRTPIHRQITPVDCCFETTFVRIVAKGWNKVVLLERAVGKKSEIFNLAIKWNSDLMSSKYFFFCFWFNLVPSINLWAFGAASKLIYTLDSGISVIFTLVHE